MSISSTLSSAMSGLTASSRMAEVTASNISNALTEGYARREVALASRTVGSNGMGVAIGGVIRHVDTALVQDLRLSTAGQGYQQTRSGFLSIVEKALGTPDVSNSLSGRIASFERSLIEAAARPDSEARLAAVADNANGVARTLAAASQTIQEQRQRADMRIGFEVGLLNESLSNVASLNTRIREALSAGRDASALMDQRQQMVDKIAAIVPVKEVARERGEIALFTSGGTILLEGRPVSFEFTRAGSITAEMDTSPGGGLSGLSVKGQPISTAPAGGRLGEGSLSALFDVRDTLATEAQSQLDGVARDLIERFAAPGLDPTLLPGTPGLFTNRGAALVPPPVPGLAGRVQLNAAVHPEGGAAYWLLREGLGADLAVGPTQPGRSDQLSSWTAALVAGKIPSPGPFSAEARSFAGLASEFASSLAVKRLSVEAEAAFSAARSSDLRSALLRDGVDTDAELQNLMQIEKAYAANAKVIKTADEMLQVILGI